MNRRQVVICGGGTGGHLFPALVLGKTLRLKDPSLKITFIGSHRAEERALMARQGVRFIPLRVEGLVGRGLRKFKSLALLPFALIRSYVILWRLKPALVVGVGSYSSGPVVLAAARMKIPILLLEQNVIPGFTNRRLIGRAERVAAAFEASLVHLKGKGVFLGNPVREEFSHLPRKIHIGTFHLLIIGGSQGSHFLNLAVTGALPFLERWKGRLRIVHQTGQADLAEVRKRYAQSAFPEAVVEPFFDDMPDRFAEADVVVGRAGATCCAELIAARKASILVPFAKAADDHQRKNAEALAETGGADIILESDWTPRRFAATLGRMIDNPERLTDMENALSSLAVEDSAGKIATLALALMARNAAGESHG